jgi:hypothetical protein
LFFGLHTPGRKLVKKNVKSCLVFHEFECFIFEYQRFMLVTPGSLRPIRTVSRKNRAGFAIFTAYGSDTFNPGYPEPVKAHQAVSTFFTRHKHSNLFALFDYILSPFYEGTALGTACHTKSGLLPAGIFSFF